MDMDMNGLLGAHGIAEDDNPVSWIWQRRRLAPERQGQWGDWEDFQFFDSPFIGCEPDEAIVQVRFWNKVSGVWSEGFDIPTPTALGIDIKGILQKQTDEFRGNLARMAAEASVAITMDSDARGIGSVRVCAASDCDKPARSERGEAWGWDGKLYCYNHYIIERKRAGYEG